MKRIGIATLCVAAVIVIAGAAAATASATSYGAAAWGNNGSGQLGDETTRNSDVPTNVSKLSEVTAVSAGDAHSLALLKGGHVMAWGANGSGQLGDETTTSSDVAVEVSKLSEVTAVSAGGAHSLALLEDGHVMAWGANGSGQLGNGTTTNSDVPVEVSGLSEVIAVSAGEEYSLALLKDGHVMAWGYDRSGQLGDGTTASSDAPEEVSGLTDAIAVSAGSGHSMALLSGGTVAAWGSNRFGVLSSSHTGPETCTRAVVGVFEERTEEYGCSLTPVTVSGLSEVTAISAGGEGQFDEYSLALLAGGTVKSWGDNSVGQLGAGTLSGPELCGWDVEVELGFYHVEGPCDATPSAVDGLSDVTAVSAGGNHSLALLTGGTVKSWGANYEGQLGDGTTTSSDLPVNVKEINEVAGISAGVEYGLSYGAPIPPPPPPPAVPVVTGVSPSAGATAGGTSVAISGEKFTGAEKVYFGGAEAASFKVNSATSITAVSPSKKPGTVNITVTNSEGSSVTSPVDRFTFAPEGTIEFGKCVNVGAGKGKYRSATCTESLAGGKFEWTPGVVKAGFAIADGTETVEKVVKPRVIVFDTVGKSTMVCRNVSGAGAYAGSDGVADVVMRLTDCELAGTKCASPGAATGEIVSTSLEGALGWREKEGNNVGLEIAGTGEGETFVEASCGSASVKVRGSVIAEVGSVDKTAAAFGLKFKESKGRQKPEQFEGEADDVLEMSISGGAFEQVGLSGDMTLANEEALEINTVL
ncbi:MAG: IPT/TIG domain-containing protein [Solirubrobacteraceae bacterium]